MNLLDKAIGIAVQAHAGQTDRSGRPYILHPLWVMNQVRHLGDDYMIVAILHDVIEDSDWTIEHLIARGFGRYAQPLQLLTKEKGADYDEYIRRVALDPIARAVKLKDLEHNSMITRLKGLRKKDFDRIEKYHRAYTYLKE